MEAEMQKEQIVTAETEKISARCDVPKIVRGMLK